VAIVGDLIASFTLLCIRHKRPFVVKRLGSPYRSGGVEHWLKIKNPAAPAVKREAEEDWGASSYQSVSPGRGFRWGIFNFQYRQQRTKVRPSF
jgi:hypothetical protein